MHPPSCQLFLPGHSLDALPRLVSHLTPLLEPYTSASNFIALWRLSPFHTLLLTHALWARGAVPVLLNARWTAHEVSNALACLPCTAILVAPEVDCSCFSGLFVLQFAAVAPFSYLLQRGDSGMDTLPSANCELSQPLQTLRSAPAAVFFTSATTAQPKAVPLSFSNLIVQANMKRSLFRLSAASVYLHLAPLYHVGGFSSALAISLAHGTHVFPPSTATPSTHAGALNALIREYSVSYLVVVPAILRLLLDNLPANSTFPAVKTVLYGGSAATPSLVQQSQAVYRTADIFGAYGMTETASSITFLHHNLHPSSSILHASAGRPAMGVEIRIDSSTMHATKPPLHHGNAVVGEVLTRGKHVFSGYYRQEDCFIDGWFRTGDIGYLYDGHLFLMGRLRDVIKSGGENVFAREVELVLETHPFVNEAAVVGVPHRVMGEAVAAVVVLACGADEKGVVQKLQAFCSNILASFKRPRCFVPVADLPRNATGKVIKETVKEMARHAMLKEGAWRRSKL